VKPARVASANRVKWFCHFFNHDSSRKPAEFVLERPIRL
jgi:hypothetical protein